MAVHLNVSSSVLIDSDNNNRNFQFALNKTCELHQLRNIVISYNNSYMYNETLNDNGHDDLEADQAVVVLIMIKILERNVEDACSWLINIRRNILGEDDASICDEAALSSLCAERDIWIQYRETLLSIEDLC